MRLAEENQAAARINWNVSVHDQIIQCIRRHEKRKAGLPDSPATIERLAKTHWASYASKMKKHKDADLPGRFCNKRGVEYLELSDLLEGLTFDMEDYSCLLYTSPSPRDLSTSRMPSSA